MAEYTITIKDDDFGIVVNLSGPSGLAEQQGPAARLALKLTTLAPKLLAQAACGCEQCQIVRAQAEPKPTLH